METSVNRAVGASVEVEHGPEGNSDTSKEWAAPKLRKVDIAEITANGGIFSSDGILSS